MLGWVGRSLCLALCDGSVVHRMCCPIYGPRQRHPPWRIRMTTRIGDCRARQVYSSSWNHNTWAIETSALGIRRPGLRAETSSVFCFCHRLRYTTSKRLAKRPDTCNGGSRRWRTRHRVWYLTMKVCVCERVRTARCLCGNGIAG